MQVFDSDIRVFV